MVDFVRPSFLGTKAEFCNMFERPILNGQCVDSTPQDIKLMQYRAFVLHKQLQVSLSRKDASLSKAGFQFYDQFFLVSEVFDALSLIFERVRPSVCPSVHLVRVRFL